MLFSPLFPIGFLCICYFCLKAQISFIKKLIYMSISIFLLISVNHIFTNYEFEDNYKLLNNTVNYDFPHHKNKKLYKETLQKKLFSYDSSSQENKIIWQAIVNMYHNKKVDFLNKDLCYLLNSNAISYNKFSFLIEIIRCVKLSNLQHYDNNTMINEGIHGRRSELAYIVLIKRMQSNGLDIKRVVEHILRHNSYNISNVTKNWLISLLLK